MTTHDVIVLGLGATGSAALQQLARRGVRMLGIDRFAPPHDHGSSHGETRITRLAIGEGEHYTPLAKRSHEIWRAMEGETGVRLLEQTGGLIISSGSGTAHTHVEGFFDNTLEAARKHGIAHEMLDAAEIRRRFPAFGVQDDEKGYYEPEAGYLCPEACVQANLDLARKYGATIRTNERALRFDHSAQDVTVTTEKGAYTAAKLVLAAGAWLPELLDPTHTTPFKVYRQTLMWFEPRGDVAQFEQPNFPIFIWELSGFSQGLYGFPAIGGARGGMKVASEDYSATTTPDAAPRELTQQEIAATHATLIAPHFPDLSDICVRHTTCLYTVTPDAGFVIDTHPDSDRVIVASPCSGHGFKHSAALGEVIADLALNGRTGFDISPFRLSRFSHA
ncbi:MAG TPA: N-methyl-L-tryptophan oxidase [Rhizomicrobium sp.]|jgi:sarcosine oxidase|nr:N-methyl-L-tryptophan oxidase [Rhizomicrobium sp.]